MGKNLPKRYAIVLLTFLCTSVCYIERVGFSIAYTVAADAAGINQSSKGLILSTFFYGYALSQVPGGWAAQRLGGRCVLLLSFALWSLISALLPPDPSKVNTLVIARLLVGVAQGFIFPSIHTVLAQWVPPHERSRSVSLTTSGMYFGAAIGMLMLPGLVQLRGPRTVFLAEAAMGAVWAMFWFKYATDPPRSDHPKASAAGFGESTAYGHKKMLLPLSIVKENGNTSLADSIQRRKVESIPGNIHALTIPWKNIMLSWPVWAIVVNSFTFHYALYVLMNWLPTYFEKGGVIADHLITRKLFSITNTRKLLNTGGFLVSAVAFTSMPSLRTSFGAVLCSSISLGFLALGRVGFAVNHMDVAPRYVGIVMEISNTAGTLTGIVGVGLTGQLLESAKAAQMDISDPPNWTMFLFSFRLTFAYSALSYS